MIQCINASAMGVGKRSHGTGRSDIRQEIRRFQDLAPWAQSFPLRTFDIKPVKYSLIVKLKPFLQNFQKALCFKRVN